MARRRETSITEEIEELLRLEKLYRGKPEFARVTTLRLMQANPALSIGEVAAQIGYSVPTIKRWLKIYRTGGLELLLQMNSGGRPDASDEGLDRLKKKLMAGEFRSFTDAHRWMERYHHSLAGRKFTRQAMNRKDTTQPKEEGMANENEMDVSATESSSTAPLIPNNILRFLSSIPTTPNGKEWMEGFRAALIELLGDVDRITMGLNIQCRIIRPEKDITEIGISEMGTGDDRRIVYTDDQLGDGTAQLDRVFARMREGNFPFEDYQAPKAFAYHYGDVAYLGAMVLWRERGKPPISERTLATIEQLRPFFIFLFSDIAARNQVSKPVDSAFAEAIQQLKASLSLTVQEERVFMLQLYGCSYEEIAELLKISLNTVRSHLKAIYGKTGTHGPSQFIAKYLAPSVARPAAGE